MTFPEILFYAFAAIAVVAASIMVGALRSTVGSIVGLVSCMLSLAGIYVLLGAHLVAAIQVLVYAGAIVVLFLFVVMFYDLRRDALPTGRHRVLRVLGALLGVFLLDRGLRVLGPLGEAPPLPEGFGGHRELGLALFTDYVLVVEVVALLLTTAIVGGLILTKKRPE